MQLVMYMLRFTETECLMYIHFSKSRVHPDEEDKTSQASDQISVVDLTASKPPMDKKNMFSGSVWDVSSRKSSHSKSRDRQLHPTLFCEMLLLMQWDAIDPMKHAHDFFFYLS